VVDRRHVIHASCERLFFLIDMHSPRFQVFGDEQHAGRAAISLIIWTTR